MNNSRYSRFRLSLLSSLLFFLLNSTLSKGQVVEFKGHGVRQHILYSDDSFSKRTIAYEPADVSLVLDNNSVQLIETYGINEVDTVLFEIKNEVFKESAFYFDLIDVKNPTSDLKGQFRPQSGEFIILSYDRSIAIVYLNVRRKKTPNEPILDNKMAWKNRGLEQ